MTRFVVASVVAALVACAPTSPPEVKPMRAPPSSIDLPPATGGAPRRLVVVLHGVGADAADVAPIARALQRALPDHAFLVPDGLDESDLSPSGRQWFSRAGIDDASRPLRVAAAARDLSPWLDAQLAQRGLDASRLVLVGFSQGAILSYDLALRRRTPPAAVVAIAGRFAVEDAVLPRAPRALPVLIVHGTADAIIPVAFADEAADRMRAVGATVDVAKLDGLGHGVDARALDAIAAFLSRSSSAP